MKVCAPIVGFALCVCLSLPVSAALLVSETFNYPAGSLHGQSGGTGFTGSWQAQGDLPPGQPTAGSWQEFRVQTGPISYPGYDDLGRSISTQTNSGSLSTGDLREANRPIAPLSSTQYPSLYLGFSFVKTGSYGFGTGSPVLELIDSSKPTQTVHFGHTRTPVHSPVIGPNGEPTGGTAMGVHFHIDVAGTRSLAPEPFSWHTGGTGGINVPYFMLIKLVFMEEVTVALLSYTTSPATLPTEDPIWDTWIGVNPLDLTFDTLRVRAQGRNEAGLIGDIRIGTTLSDVLLVPEPASMSLLGLGGLVAIRRRR